jgi:hypothetical protein
MSIHFERFADPDIVARDAFAEYAASPLPALPLRPTMRISPGVPLWTAEFGATLERAIPLAARWLGWRYFAFDDTDAVALDVTTDGAFTVATRVFGGASARASLDALAKAEDIAEGQKAVPARILSIPSVFFLGIWLLAEPPWCIEITEEGETAAAPSEELFGDLGRRAEARIAAREAATRK